MSLSELTQNTFDCHEYQAEVAYKKLQDHAVSLGTRAYPVLVKGLKTYETRWLDMFEKNNVHDKGCLHWAGWFSFLTTDGNSLVKTFQAPGNAKYSFIAAAGVNKGKEGVSGKIIAGGIGESTVTIHFKSSVQGAWHILVIFASDDPELRAIT